MQQPIFSVWHQCWILSLYSFDGIVTNKMLNYSKLWERNTMFELIGYSNTLVNYLLTKLSKYFQNSKWCISFNLKISGYIIGLSKPLSWRLTKKITLGNFRVKNFSEFYFESPPSRKVHPWRFSVKDESLALYFRPVASYISDMSGKCIKFQDKPINIFFF